jgi:hypothetical protein
MITSIEISATEEVAGGHAFGATGPYLRLIGTAAGELDPERPENRGIVNLENAPRNAAGRVEYRADVFILRPADPARGNGRLLYEVNNRGRKLLFANLCAGSGSNDLKNLEDFGDALPLRLGFSLIWSGWDATVGRANGNLGLSLPAPQVAGQAMTGRVRDQFVAGTRPDSPGEIFRLSYPAAALDPATVRVTRRRRQADPPEIVPATDWAFLDERRLRLLPEERKPEPGTLYDVTYLARDPLPLGAGFAATRDLISRLRYGAETPHSAAETLHSGAATLPSGSETTALLGRRPNHVLAFGISQAGRYLRDHIAQGFNRDEAGRRVFDGVLAHTAGIGRLFLNHAFGQPFRTNTRHEDHEFPENEFPFSPVAMPDPVTGREGALLRGDGSDPLLIQTNTSTEYWQKGASLLHTDPLGEHDVALPEGVRLYLIAGTQHGGRPGSPRDRGPALHLRNPHNPMPALRALLVALDAWVVTGRAPPPSAVPSLAEGSLVPPDATGFPEIPGIAVARAANLVRPPGDWVAPAPSGAVYRCLVCRVDGDGNEVAGVRLPDIAVPRGTYTGWNLYRAPYPEGELADRDGSFIPFAKTTAERLEKQDPRPSLEERYGGGRPAYVAAVERAAAALVSARFLLPEDASAYVEQARNESSFD